MSLERLALLNVRYDPVVQMATNMLAKVGKSRCFYQKRLCRNPLIVQGIVTFFFFLLHSLEIGNLMVGEIMVYWLVRSSSEQKFECFNPVQA